MAIEFEGRICPMCKGSGESKHEEDDYTCPQCDGEGYIAETVRIKSSKKSEE